jgi:hypothetical protein
LASRVASPTSQFFVGSEHPGRNSSALIWSFWKRKFLKTVRANPKDRFTSYPFALQPSEPQLGEEQLSFSRMVNPNEPIRSAQRSPPSLESAGPKDRSRLDWKLH